MIISHNFISILQKNYHKQILKQEILSEKMSDKNLKLKTFRINCLTNKNLTNMPLKFILPSNILIFKMIIPANVIFMTTVLKTISTFLNTLKMIIIVKKRYFDTKINYKFTPILFTKLANVTIVENHFLMLVI